jgi:hypothetical protein
MRKNLWNDEKKLKCIVENSNNYTECIKKLRLSLSHGNYDTLKKYIKVFNINIEHFTFKGNLNHSNKKLPLEDILIENSTFSRFHLKNRLYKEGVKQRNCEICGQSEEWNGNHMSLILDHINGINDDNRIENLRIVCPNCNATLPTHCGKNIKNKKIYFEEKEIKYCLTEYKYCECGNIIQIGSNSCSKCLSYKRRIAERPPLEQLLKEVEELGYSATGRKYGVSDNAIRKWIKNYKK